MTLFGRKSKTSAETDSDGDLSSPVDAPQRSKPQQKDSFVDNSAVEASADISREDSLKVKGATEGDDASAGTKGTKRGYTEVKQQALDMLNNSSDRRKMDDVEMKEDGSDLSDGSEDLEPVEVLLQFIPFYGQGDPSNDRIVRSTLSQLSVEDIDSKDEYGNTLLLLACQYRCEDLVRIMLNKGADANALNSSGACGLHFACYRDSASLTIVKILLKNGANPDVPETTYGCTPLHYCASNGDMECCKLLLSYGAQINAIDYYNYTCVDYAREGNFDEVVAFLQKRLDKFNSQNNAMTGTLTTAKSFRFASSKNSGFSSTEDMSEWESHIDPESRAKYYINSRTGECLWESELKDRIAQQQQQQQQQAPKSPQDLPLSLSVKSSKASSGVDAKQVTFSSTSSGAAPSTTAGIAVRDVNQERAQNEMLINQATQAMLIAFLSKHAPERLTDIDDLCSKYNAREKQLFEDLRKQYNVEADPQDVAFQAKLDELRGVDGRPAVVFDARVSDPQQIDPLLLQNLAHEARKKLEGQFEEELTNAKKRFETQLDEERHSYQKQISEKEGLIAKLQTQIETVEHAKSSCESEISALNNRMAKLQASGGEAMSQLDSELQHLKDENSALRAQISQLQQDLNVEKERLASLEVTLANLTSGKEEMIEREQAAAAERAEKQRQREVEFANELREMETKAKNIELKLKSDVNQTKNELIRTEKQLKMEYDQLKRGKDSEIEDLRRELAERKAQFVQELSAANMEAENNRRAADEAMQRAVAAEEFQVAAQAEIAEARIVQKYNAQLHKDLLREQMARRKLHNDIEDMKGKIRVYVRIRPFSTSELERGCQEAVTKDGKMSVCVKGIGGPDQKKFYDFDSIFGGTDGNTQADVFKDTKHLIMSVIDGYNVCVFAYGQTGAGKSYTMIGGSDIGSSMTENGEFNESAGVTPRAISELFRLLNERSAQITFVVEVQMFQLYRDGLEDLLKEKKRKKKDDDDGKDKDPPLKITLAEHSPTGLVYVDGAETMIASTPGDVIRILSKGSSRRATASTQMNAESSRSHLICSLVVKLTNRRSGAQSIGKLTLVDLAGSERVDKSGATGEQLKEAQSINKSLSALGDVIAALTTNQQHVPYRNHPLTMLMSDSIGGNAKTLMFVNTSPADYNANESNNSLGFANRCKDITNMVAAGPGVQAAQMNALKKELAKLKKGGGGGGGGGAGSQARAPPAQTLTRPDTAAGGRGSQK